MKEKALRVWKKGTLHELNNVTKKRKKLRK